MTEGIREEQQASSETETQLSPEAQRAKDLLESATTMLALLKQHRKGTQAMSLAYYERNDPLGREIHRMLGWHQKTINDIEDELSLTINVTQYILTGAGDYRERPENVPSRLEDSKKHYNLEEILNA